MAQTFSNIQEFSTFLKKFHLNRSQGFLSYFDNLHIALPSKFEHSHKLACNISQLLHSKDFIKEIQKLKVTQEELSEISDHQKATKVYSIYAYLTNTYIHTIAASERKIPPQLWIPYTDASKKLGIREIYTLWAPLHAFTIKDQTKPFSHDNIKLLYNFTNTPSEENFFKANFLSTTSLKFLLDFSFELNHICYKYYDQEDDKIDFSRFSEDEKAKCNLEFKNLDQIINLSLDEMKKIFNNMDPLVFFDDMRFFFRGYSAYANEGGLHIENSQNLKLNYVGPSSGQDPSIFLLKVLLGITYPESMRNYEIELMEGFRKPHQDFIRIMRKISLVHKLKEFEEVRENFECCLISLRKYYKIHKGLVVEFMEKPGIKKNMDISKMRGVGETPIDIIKNINNFI